MKKTVLATILAATLYGLPAWADAFKVSDIRIEGLQRISASSVFSTLPVNVGDQIDDQRISEALKALFKTGNFQDIQIGRDGNVLVISVSERPSISSIELEGNKSIEKDKLLDGLAQSGLAQGSVFKRETLDRVRLELQRQYIAQGRYGARIEPSVTPQPRNRVALKIKVVEGEVAAIKEVNIVGNKVFEEADLLDVFELKSSHFWSFIKGDDKYSREKLSGDLENLRSYYLDHGYINFAIESTQVSITPDKQSVYITVNVHEGEKFSVNEVKLAGDLVVKEQDLNQLLLVRKGQTFSRQLVTLTEDLLRKRLGNDGYTFAKINGVPEINEKDKTVNITFFVDPDRRVYVRRVNFSGNEKSRDEVMRREMRQMEGAWASTQSIELGKTRLERLGFFKGVEVETPRVAGTEDQVDVNYKVEEQPSGSIGASVGFQQGTGLVFGANVSQSNWLGTGNNVSFGLNRNQYRSSYSFKYVNPYYTVDGVSRGFSLFYTTTDFAKASSNISRYATDRKGGNVNFGYPINENERLSFALGYELTTVFGSSYSSPFVRDFIDYVPVCSAVQDTTADIALVASTSSNCIGLTGVNKATQSASFQAFNVTGTWYRSTLNKGVLPDRGASNQISLEVTAPRSDLSYYKLSYSTQRFLPLVSDWTLRLRGDLGYGDGYGNTKQLPFYENYYSGGYGSVRGYQDRTLGPLDNNTLGALPFGGNVLVEGGAEFIFPVPFVKDKRSIRTAFFVEAGNVFDTHRTDEPGLEITPSELRYSAGFGLTWITAIGPMAFSLAKPFHYQRGDERQVFQFSLGQVF